MNSNINDAERLAKLFYKSRNEAGVSQEHMALALNVTRPTIRNWESGASSPTLKQAFQWFRVLGQNPMRPFLDFLFPEIYENINCNSSAEDYSTALHNLIDIMHEDDLARLSYFFFGKHGSSPISLMQLWCAYLQNDMKFRVSIARSIVDSYEMNNARNELVCPNTILPNVEMLTKSIELGKAAVIKGQKGYSSNNQA